MMPIWCDISSNARQRAKTDRLLLTKNKTAAQTRYSTSDLIAIEMSAEHFHKYLYDRQFFIYTDHKPLQGIHSKQEISDILRRLIRICNYEFVVI